MKLSRIRGLIASVLVGAAGAASAACPERPVALAAPEAPGGSTDILARAREAAH